MTTVPADPHRSRKTLGCLSIIVLIVLGFSAGLAFSPPTPAVADDFDACYMAQKFMRDTLKAPSTATFAPCQAPDSVVTQTKRIWHVRSWVDAQNGFGAMLRNRFTADLIYYPATDTWTLVDLTTLD